MSRAHCYTQYARDPAPCLNQLYACNCMSRRRDPQSDSCAFVPGSSDNSAGKSWQAAAGRIGLRLANLTLPHAPLELHLRAHANIGCQQCLLTGDSCDGARGCSSPVMSTTYSHLLSKCCVASACRGSGCASVEEHLRRLRELGAHAAAAALRVARDLARLAGTHPLRPGQRDGALRLLMFLQALEVPAAELAVSAPIGIPEATAMATAMASHPIMLQH